MNDLIMILAAFSLPVLLIVEIKTLKKPLPRGIWIVLLVGAASAVLATVLSPKAQTLELVAGAVAGLTMSFAAGMHFRPRPAPSGEPEAVPSPAQEP
jgi:membrane associated rhomboid family serine protease